MKKYITMLSIAGLLMLIAWVSPYIGMNMTESVPFRFYYHTSIDNYSIKPYDYLLFKMPENELYPSGTPIVKQAVCVPGQVLRMAPDIGGINIYCDDAIVTKTTRFETSTGTPLSIFDYNGRIPGGHYFMTGSHKDSYDSRYWGFMQIDSDTRLVHPLKLVTDAYAEDFYAAREKGWYKYEEPPINDNLADNSTDNDTFKDFIKPLIPWERVSVMHPEAFKKLFTEVEAYAMSYRTLSNFEDYAKMRTVMVNRSMEFMNVGTLWAQLNPEDTTESWHPTSAFGQNAYQAEVSTIKSDYIRANRDDYGILYFYRTDCNFCQKQAPVIRYFEEMSTWIIKGVDTDKYPDSMARFNIKSVPTLILIERKTERWLPLSSGLMTAEEIEDRLYRTIKYLKGESDEKDFTDPIRPDYLVQSRASIVGR